MKKQIFKRLLSAILSTVMMLVMMPTIALPTFAETYNGTCGENLTWSLDTGTGTLTISGTGEMSDYNVGYDAPWEDFFHSMDMLTVIIEEGVTSIGKNAFSLTHIIKSVVIPEGVTSIGEGAFADSGVKSIVIPASVINVGEDAFAICNIETIYYGGNKTSWDK